MIRSLFPFVGPLVSYVINRWSCRVAAIISGFCMLLGFSLSYFAPNLIFLIGTFGAISGEFNCRYL